MNINSKELSTRYGIDLPSGKYSVTSDGEYYSISVVKDDTEGCILVGATNTKGDDDFIGSSKKAFGELMLLLESAMDPITIEIV